MTPRPPGPCSPAPGLPLTTLALVVLLIAAAVTVVSAETITGNIYDPQYEVQEHPTPGDVLTPIRYMALSDWQIYCSNPSDRVWPTQIVIHNALISQSGEQYASTENYRIYNGNLTYDGINYADVHVEYQKMKYDGSKSRAYYTVVINLEWDYTKLNSLTGGAKTFTFTGDGLQGKNFTSIAFESCGTTPLPPTRLQHYNYVVKYIYPCSERGYVQYYMYLDTFEQSYTVSTDENGIHIDLIRVINGKTNPSKLIVTDLNGSSIYESPTHIDLNGTYHFPNTDVVVALESLYSTLQYEIYRGTPDDPDDPDDPGDPGTGPGGFALALSPASVQVGETVTATLLAAAAAPHYSYIVWSCTPDDHPDMATWSYRIQDENGTWYERAANGDEIPISSADALTYQATPAYPGGHHIGVTIYDHHPPCQGLEQRATLAKSFEALYKSGSSPVRIQVIDERTGGLIAGSHIQVIDSQLPPFEGTGVNPIIDTTLPQGSEMFYLQRNAYDEPRYRIFADADGYRQVTENQWFSVNPPAPNTVTTVTVQMAAAAAPPEDPNNAYVTFRIRDEDGNPVKEARVTLDRWTRFALGTRPVTFEVPRGTYQYTVEPIDPGLYPATGSVTVGEEDSYEVNVVLSRTPGPGDDPGATPPPGPTPDRRTNEEKGQAVIDMIADNAEGIGALALICLIMGLLKLMVKW